MFLGRNVKICITHGTQTIGWWRRPGVGIGGCGVGAGYKGSMGKEKETHVILSTIKNSKIKIIKNKVYLLK